MRLLKSSSSRYKAVTRAALFTLTVVLTITGVQANTLVYAVTGSTLQSLHENTPFYDPNEPWCGSGASAANTSANLVGNDNLQKLFNYFVSQGYTAEQSAGIVGNITQESRGDPEIFQKDGHDYPIPPTTTQPPYNDPYGWGIAQWTPPVKIMNYSKATSEEPQQLATQVEFLAKQLAGTAPNDNEAKAGTELKKTTTVDDAAVAFMVYYERPADHDPNGPNAQIRKKYAEQALKLYGAGSQGSASSCGGGIGGAGCAGGNGSGPFQDTNNTAIPNVQKMCDRAKQIADPSSALFKEWWSTGFGGKCANVGPGTCNEGWCAYTAAFIWGYDHAGYDYAAHNDNLAQNPIYAPNAGCTNNLCTYVWNALLVQGLGHPGDRNPPVGALLFYNNGTVPPSGHIVIYLGHNTLVSSDMSSSGTTKLGYVGIVPAKAMESGPWTLKYLGWAYPKFNSDQHL